MKRPLNKPTGAPTNNTKAQGIAVVNVTDDSMFKEQELEMEDTSTKKNSKEDEKLKKEKEEEEKYKKQLEAAQLEERKQIEEKLTEEEQIYAEQKRIEEEKRQKKAEKLERIMNFNFDDDDESIGEADLDSDTLFSDSDEFPPDELSITESSKT